MLKKRDNDQKVVERKEAAKLREKQLADLTRKEEEEKKTTIVGVKKKTRRTRIT